MLSDQEKKLHKLLNAVESPEVSILELDKKIDETKTELQSDIKVVEEKAQQALSIAEETKKTEVPGIQGEKGEDGKDYILTDQDKEEIATLASMNIEVPVVEKVIEKTEVIKEIPIVTENVVEVAKSDTPEQTRDKLESLKEDERLDKKAIKGLEAVVDQPILDRAIGILDQRTSFLINKVNNLPKSSGASWGSISGTLSAQTTAQGGVWDFGVGNLTTTGTVDVGKFKYTDPINIGTTLTLETFELNGGYYPIFKPTTAGGSEYMFQKGGLFLLGGTGDTPYLYFVDSVDNNIQSYLTQTGTGDLELYPNSSLFKVNGNLTATGKIDANGELEGEFLDIVGTPATVPPPVTLSVTPIYAPETEVTNVSATVVHLMKQLTANSATDYETGAYSGGSSWTISGYAVKGDYYSPAADLSVADSGSYSTYYFNYDFSDGDDADYYVYIRSDDGTWYQTTNKVWNDGDGSMSWSSGDSPIVGKTQLYAADYSDVTPTIYSKNNSNTLYNTGVAYPLDDGGDGYCFKIVVTWTDGSGDGTAIKDAYGLWKYPVTSGFEYYYDINKVVIGFTDPELTQAGFRGADIAKTYTNKLYTYLTVDGINYYCIPLTASFTGTTIPYNLSWNWTAPSAGTINGYEITNSINGGAYTYSRYLNTSTFTLYDNNSYSGTPLLSDVYTSIAIVLPSCPYHTNVNTTRGNSLVETLDLYYGHYIKYNGTTFIRTNPLSSVGGGTTQIGIGAGANNEGKDTVAIGYNAGRDCTSNRDGNVAIGTQSLEQNTSGGMSALGFQTGQFNQGANCAFLGYGVGRYNRGSFSNGIGYLSLSRDSTHYNTGSNVSAIGYLAGGNNKGDSCSLIGTGAGSDNTGDAVCVIGNNAATDNAGDQCVFVGTGSGGRNQGDYVFGFGTASAIDNKGSNNGFLGTYADINNSVAGIPILTNTLVIGAPILAFRYNTIYFNGAYYNFSSSVANLTTTYSEGNMYGGNNLAGVSSIHRVGAGTGTGTIGTWKVQVPVKTTSGNTIQTFTDRIIVGENGVQLLGAQILSYVAKTATYAITASDYTIDCTANTFTCTLPTAVGCTGQVYIIKNSGTGVITVATTSSQTIDGDLTLTLDSGDGVTVQSTNTNWIII